MGIHTMSRSLDWKLTRALQIRCSGYDASEDGRCTNCVRFSQECLFTPVSSQASAFVPAHVAHPHLRGQGGLGAGRGGRPPYPPTGGQMLYGAHGQPLGPMPPHDPNAPPPPPQGYYSQPPYMQQGYDDRGGAYPPPDQVSRKRPRVEDPITPVLASPYPETASQNQSSQPYQQRPDARNASGYEYPDPTNLAPVSPASSAASYATAQPGPGQYGYPPAPPATQPQPRRTSPQSVYSYDNRASGSPHSATASTNPYQYPNLHPPQVLPPTREAGRTPPPTTSAQSTGNSGGGGRGGMSVRDMLATEQSRSTTDTDMLKALNRRV